MTVIRRSSVCHIGQSSYSQIASGCLEQATVLVYDRRMEKVLPFCSGHAEAIMIAAKPEYTVNCPNCKCLIPVN